MLDSVRAARSDADAAPRLDRRNPARARRDRGGAADRRAQRRREGPRLQPAAAAPTPTAGSEVEITGAQDFDPDGGDGEHPDEVKLAIDGIPATVWPTETYTAGPDLSALGQVRRRA